MRSRHHTSGTAWKVRTPSDPLPAPAPVQTSALDLPGEHKFGLVSLLKSGPRSPATLICARLDEQGVPYPKYHPHWHDMKVTGYVTMIDGRHALTPKGLGAAKVIIADLCIKFAVHVFELDGGRGTGRGMITTCSCRKFTHGPEMNTPGGESRIRAAQRSHMREVETPGWPKRSMIDCLNQYDPLSFDFMLFGFPHTSPTG